MLSAVDHVVPLRQNEARTQASGIRLSRNYEISFTCLMPLNTDFSTVLTLPVFQHVKAAAEAGAGNLCRGGFVRDHLLGRKKEKTDLDFVCGFGPWPKPCKNVCHKRQKSPYLKPMARP